jgi:phage terminase small subunit
MPLLQNSKHELFAQAIARGKTLTEAQAAAGLSENAGNAITIRDRPEVTARIEELKMIVAKRAEISGERILAELARIGFSDITNVVNIEAGKVQIVDTKGLSPDIKAAISEIRQTRDGLSVKFHDKVTALERLGAHIGLFKENIDLNVNVSLADLVNGSFELERGELKPKAPAAIEHMADKLSADDPDKPLE